MSIKEICDISAEARFETSPNGKLRKTSFSLRTVTDALLENGDIFAAAPSLVHLEAALSQRAFRHLCTNLFRFALFGQFVNDAVTSTWYQTRWSSTLADEDPRRASVEECVAIIETLASMLAREADETWSRQVLEDIARSRQMSDGLPIDYVRAQSRDFHHPSNVHVLNPGLSKTIVTQRELICSDANPSRVIFEAAYKKIHVKSYLTDRAQTGEHKTNRELRWEAHPRSVQFALKKDCIEIEAALVDQLCHLEGLPVETREYLTTHNLHDPNRAVQHCPVTLEPLQWGTFAAEMLKATHGRSSFHVGHLNPLKSLGADSPEWGHTAANISWISDDGNRIQGHRSLAEVQQMLRKISENYGWSKS